MKKRVLFILGMLFALNACSAPMDVAITDNGFVGETENLNQTEVVSTVQITNTATPTESLPRRVTATPTPTSIAVTPVPIISGPIENVSQMIVLWKYGEDTIEIIDLATGRYIGTGNSGNFRWIIGVYDSCSVLVKKENQVLRMNLFGEGDLEMLNVHVPEDQHFYNVIFSPDYKYVSYVFGHGYQEYNGYEIQDIYVQNLGSGEVYPITSNGGGGEGSWSHDGKLLAFSDYDEKGVHQVFVSDPLGENRQQVTAFDNPENEIRWEIAWSPDNQSLLFVYYLVEEGLKMGVVTLSENEPSISFIPGFMGIRSFWWYNDTSFVIYAEKEGNSRNGGIFLIDVSTTQIIDQLLYANFSDIEYSSSQGIQPFTYVEPFGSTRYAGLFFWNSFYVYDLAEKQVYSYENVTGGFEFFEWYPIPFSPDASGSCDQMLP